jgi:putative ABC transport system permease protein
MSELLSRLHFLVRQTLLRHKRQSELDEELQFHVEQSTEANIAAGMTAEEARRQARASESRGSSRISMIP